VSFQFGGPETVEFAAGGTHASLEISRLAASGTFAGFQGPTPRVA